MTDDTAHPGTGAPSPRPLILAAHGTRDARGRATVHALADLVRARTDATVRVGWVDVIEPELASVMLPGAVLVPCFLGTGYHVRVDVPRAAAAATGVDITPALGPAPEILTVLRQRLRESGIHPDAVVLGAAGSSDPLSRAESAAAAALLENGLGVPVRAGYLTAAEPSVRDAVTGLREEGHRNVAVVSYLLAPGFFQDRLQQAGAELVTAPIGAHPEIAGLILQRYRHAVERGLVTAG